MKYLCDNRRHLICEPYRIENLHEMALVLGIKRCWYHGGRHPHYDIPKRRIAEIQSQCEIIGVSELLFRIMQWKN